MGIGSTLNHGAEFALRFVPHGLALVVVTGAFAGWSVPFLPVGLFFLAAPLVEAALGEEHPPINAGGRLDRIACCLALRSWVPLHFAVLAAGLTTLRNTDALVGALALAFPVGMLTGMFGMSSAHEFMHRRGRLARGTAWLLLTSSGYGHFLVEHVRGHHRRVGTSADPATALLGESVYAFVPRTLKGGLISAWRLEARRLRQQGHRPFDRRNVLIQSAALWALMCVVAGLIAGLPGAAFFAAQGVVGIAILEVMNYIQHYGLAKHETVRETHCSAAPALTWDCAFRLTNLLLFELGRHADHHARPARAADELETRADAPRMPAGYFTMFILALLPPLWARIMNPRAELVRQRTGRGFTPWPLPCEERNLP